MRRTACLLLVCLGLAAFAPAFENGFTNWDDSEYITENRLVHGLSWDRVATAFSSFYFSNYNPLHLVSYMADHALWGLDARGFLLTSLLFHLAAGLLAWRIVLRLAGDGRVAFLAALVFLVHPTRCESVVWLSERKDVLSGFFVLAAAWAFLRFAAPGAAARGDGGRDGGSPWRWYIASLGLFLVALLSKSQVMTLPLALLGLAVFLGRPWRRSLLEQLPFLVLAGTFAVVTLAARAAGDDGVAAGEAIAGAGVLRPLAALPRYLAHLVAPVGLAPVYELDEPRLVDVAAALQVAAGLALLAIAAWACVRSLRGRRVVLAGVCWFAAFLLPVSGVVPNQVLVADRYLYLAILGPAWIAADWLARTLRARALLVAGAALALALVALTASYACAWRDSESLWLRVLARNPESSRARANLGMERLARGRLDEARRLFEEDLAEPPRFLESFHGLAAVERAAGRDREALALCRRAVELRPESAKAQLRLVALVLDLEGPERALEELDRLRPRPEPSFGLDGLLFRIRFARGELEEARRHASLAVARQPFHEEWWYHLGLAAERLGDLEDAAGAYARAVAAGARCDPAREALAALLLRRGRAREAAEVLEEAPRRTAPAANLLALCRLELGDAEGSLAAVREAVGLRPADARYWANHARVALAGGRRREAREALGAAARRDPALVEALEPELRGLLGENDEG